MARRRRKSKTKTEQLFAGPTPMPTFAGVFQPRFTWTEVESQGGIYGFVRFPTRKTDSKALITVPSLPTPTCRFVRTHEMLHAKFSLAVYPTFRKLIKKQISPMAAQYAEDIRIAQLGFKHGIWPEDAYMEDSLMVGTAKQVAASGWSKKKLVECFLHAAFQPTEGAWGCDELEKYMEHAKIERASLPHGLFGEAHVICDAFVREVHRIFEKKRKPGKKADQNVLRELAKAVELAMRAAADIKPKEQPKQEGEGQAQPQPKQDDEPQQGSGAPAPEQDEQDDAGQDEQDEQDGAGQDGQDDEDEQDGQDGQDGEDDDEDSDSDSDGAGDSEGASKDGDSVDPKGSQDADTEESDLGEGRSPLAPNSREKGSSIDAAKKQAMENAMKEAADKIRQRVMLESGSSGGKDDGSEGDASQVMELLGAWEADCEEKDWAKTQVLIGPLRRHFRTKVPKRGRANTEGTIVRHMNRFATDGAVMCSQGRRPGGTLLIDVSGSMSWAHETTLKLMDMCPAITIAIYSSAKSTPEEDRNCSPMRGLVTIIARNGRAVSKDWRKRESELDDKLPADKREFGQHDGNNACDGPALAWLIRQPGPRIWFSDGHVSGISGSVAMFNARFTKDAFRLARVGGVTHTMSLQVVHDVFAGIQKPNPTRFIPEEVNNHIAVDNAAIIRQSLTMPLPSRGVCDSQGRDVDPKKDPEAYDYNRRRWEAIREGRNPDTVPYRAA